MTRNLKIISALILSLLLISGCAGYSDLKPQAEINSVPLTGVQTGSGFWPSEKWWKQFNDSQLDALIDEALSGNPSLSEARARIRVAEAASGIAKSADAVQIVGDAASTYQRFPEHESYPPQFAGERDTVNRLQIAAGYDFDLWGKNKADYEASLGEIMVAELESAAAKLTLTSALALDYLRLDRAYRLNELMENEFETFSRILALQKKRHAAGLDSQDAVARTESSVAIVNANLKKIHEEIVRLKMRLGTMTGAGPERGLKLNRPLLNLLAEVELPADIPAELIGRRPDISAQKWRVESLQKRIDSAKADFYPNINLNAFAGFRSIGLDNLLKSGSETFGIGPAMTLPIFNGGRLRSNLAMKNAQYDEAVERYNTLILKAVQEVADIAISGTENNKQLISRKNSVASLEHAAKLASLNFQSGLTGELPLLRTRLDILNANSTVIDLQSRQAELLVSMNRALGGGTNMNKSDSEEQNNE